MPVQQGSIGVQFNNSGMTKKLLCSSLFLVVHLLAFAGGRDSIAVTKAVEQLTTAMVNGVATELYAITAPQLSYGHSGGAVENQQAFVEKIASGKSDFVSIDISEQTICIAGNTAIVRHKLNAVTNDQGKPGQVQLKVLLIWQKQKGTWLLLARQAIKLTT